MKRITQYTNFIVVGILVLALMGIAVSVYQLQQIFLSENQRSRELLQTRKVTVENTAKQLFIAELDKRMDQAIVQMHDLEAKPFAISEGLYWQQGKRQMMPLDWHFSQLPADNVMLHYRNLRAQISQSFVDDQWPDDTKLLWEFSQSVKTDDVTAIESLARALLNYDANHRFAARHELVFRLLFVEKLATYAQASRELLHDLIRNDVRDGQGGILPALQKELLYKRNNLSREEFDFLADKIVALSSSQQIRRDDFLRVIDREGPVADFTTLPDTDQAALWNDNWYVIRRDNNRYGLRVDRVQLLQTIQQTLRARQWLLAGDSVTMQFAADTEKSFQTMDQVQFTWQSSSYNQNLVELQNFYQLKQIILAATLLSLVAVASLIYWLYRRQARWIGIKSEFVATVAHEMRTPLSSIRLMAERLSTTTQDNPKAKDYPQRILADIDTLSFLSENILSYERLQSGRWVIHASPLVISEVVEQLREELPLFVKRDFNLTMSGDDTCTVQADPTLIKLLFLNLAKNSCAYNDNTKVEINITWRASNQQLAIEFRDNGTGIDPDEWQDCFVAFYRGKDQRRTRGSGLGLALCKKIMTLHRGDIHLTDSNSEGTCFTLFLPLSTTT